MSSSITAKVFRAPSHGHGNFCLCAAHEVTRSSPAVEVLRLSFSPVPQTLPLLGTRRADRGCIRAGTTAPPYRYSLRFRIDKITGGDEAMPERLHVLSRTELIDI